MINVLIVTTDASYISFQADTFGDAGKRVERIMQDRDFYRTVTPNSPVFCRNTDRKDGFMSQYTVEGFVTEFRSYR